MGLDIWFKEDIANILRAADEANLSALAADEGASIARGAGEAAMELRCAYRRGFVAALVTLALGLPTSGIGGAFGRSAVGGGRPVALSASLVGGKRWEE